MEFLSEEASVIFECSAGTIYTLDSGVVASIDNLSAFEIGIFTNIPRDDSELYDNQPCGYIQANESFYPIILGRSKVYGGFLNNSILFMFNALLENVNVITAVNVPNDSASLLIDVLTKMNLLSVVILKKKSESNIDDVFEGHDLIYHPTGPVNPTIANFSRGLVGGAFAFSSLASKGASFCRSAIHQLGQKALSRCEYSVPQKYTVNPHLRRTLHVANVASKTLATLTAAVVRKTAKVSARVLKSLVNKGKSSVIVKRVPAKWKDTAFLLGSSALVSSGIAIHGIENALYSVGKSVFSVTSDVIKAKHGIEAGTAAADALKTAGSTVLAWHNLSNFTIRNLAEKGAKLAVSNEKISDEIKVGDCIEISP